MSDLSAPQTMTAKEVADILGVTPEAIKKHVRELFPESLKNGVETHLDQHQITAIKKRMIPTTSVVGSVTDLEMMERMRSVMEWSSAKIKLLREENDELRPKALIHDAFMQGTNSQPIGDVAKLFKVGRNKFFKLLRDSHILMSDNIPYQEYMKYFEVVEKPVHIGGDIVNKIVTLVKPEGVTYLQKRFFLSAGNSAARSITITEEP